MCYFEITPSIEQLNKDLKTFFVFKFRPKTKKFTPKWQIPLFEKRVPCDDSQLCEVDSSLNLKPAQVLICILLGPPLSELKLLHVYTSFVLTIISNPLITIKLGPCTHLSYTRY